MNSSIPMDILRNGMSEHLSGFPNTLESLTSGFIGSVPVSLVYATDKETVSETRQSRKRARGKELRYRHNMHGTATYRSWQKMHERCGNKRHRSYPDYGGRGIRVCKQWSGKNGFWNFWQDMGDRPEGMTLDRISVDGNYEPSNVRWSDRKEQRANRRDSKR